MMAVKSYSRLFLLAACLFLGGCDGGGRMPAQGYVGSSSLKPTPEYYRAEQAFVRRSRYRRKRLLNKSEERVFWALVGYCRDAGWRVFPQVSMGEILSADDREAHRAINAKRVDFCVTDKRLLPIAIVEYHGAGHRDKTSDGRDAVKREAAEAAGIAYIAIREGEESSVGRRLSERLNRAGRTA